MEGDDRFKKFATDPKFRSVSRKDKKVKIDKRFQSMFTDKRFSNKVGVDKRGRPESFSSKETYQKYYRVNDKKEKKKGENEEQQSSSDGSSSEDEEEEEDGNAVKKPSVAAAIDGSQPDYARGEGQLESSSSEEESDEEEDDQKDEAFDKWGELDHDADHTDDISRRLAVCNLDWDRVGAQDIFLALSSFCPKNQRVESVRIYLSDFGKLRLEDEERLGPLELRQKKEAEAEDSEDEDRLISGDVVEDQDAIDKEAMERVRLYQVRKLKYYYAVAAFTSEEAANAVYAECDGQEYELSATRFDLRFIPDEMEFEAADMKDECLTLPDPDKYKPKVFFNKALMQGKAELTWDEDDPDRQAAMRRAFENPDGLNDDDLKAFIATSSGDEEDNKAPFESVVGAASDDDDDESRVEKYKALLLGGSPAAAENKNAGKSNNKKGRKEEEGNMEMTFATKGGAGGEEEEDKLKEFEGMTPWEQYLHKRKEKKKAKRLLKAKQTEEEANSDYNDDDVPDDLKNDPFFRHSDDEEKEEQVSKTKQRKMKKRDKKDEGKRSDLPLLVMDSDDDKKHFDYKEIVKTDTMSKKKLKKLKKKQEEDSGAKEDDFRVDLQDERFGAVFESADFNVDPSHPNFKKTKSMQAIVEEKQKRITTGKRKKGDLQTAVETSTDGGGSKKAKPDLTSASGSHKDSLQKLMHSVKAKSNQMQSVKANKKIKSRK